MKVTKGNIEKGTFVSSDGLNDVAYYIFTNPEVKPKAIVQISHGMVEHMLRYEDLAFFLAESGYVVCGNDHLGHGATSKGPEDDGFMGEEHGYEFVTLDLYKMTRIIKQQYPGLPLFMLGHSMGSFYCRYYAQSYSNELAGLIISGTGGPNPLGGIGLALTKVLIKFKGARAKSPFIEKLAFGAYTKRIPNAQSGREWVTRDPELFDKYVNDPRCSFKFSLAGYKDLMTVLNLVNKKEWAQSIRKDLPIFMFSGTEDPVGDYGKGVKKVYEMLIEAGAEKVKLKLYKGARHEVHNELLGTRDTLYKDLLTWLNNIE